MYNINIEPYTDLIENLKVVVIDCPYDTLHTGLTQSLFGKFVALKLNGFLAEYPYGSLPLGTYDFIGTIVMICDQSSGGLIPITCFKSSTVERATFFSLPFEVNGLFKNLNESDHSDYVSHLMAELKESHRKLAYNSSWTMDSKWGRGTQARKLLLEMSLACLTNYYQEYHITDILSAAVLRFKIDQVQKFLGFEDLTKDGMVLPPMKAWFVKDEPTALMHLKGFSPEALLLAKKFNSLWANRLTLSRTDVPEISKVA